MSLEDAHRLLHEALAKWDIIPGHPESSFIAAMVTTQRVTADIALALSHELQGVAEGARQQVEAEARRLRDHTEQARTALASAEVAQGQVVTQILKNIGPGLTKALRETVILKEYNHNKRLSLGHYAKGGALVLAVFLAGYCLRSWETFDAGKGVERCLTEGQRYADGRVLCTQTSLLNLPAVPAAPQATR